MIYLAYAISAVVYAEFIGYWLHKALHSERFPMLSRAHMLHHLRDYGPKTALRRDQYLNSAVGRHSFLGIGLEWIGPIAVIVVFSISVLTLLQVEMGLQIFFVSLALSWGYFLFGYMHSSLHLRNFWVYKIPLLKRWHRRITQLHDFHHLQISEDGRMLINYGICFYWFDRLFGTYSPKEKPFNPDGYSAALVRYEHVLKD